MNYNNKNVINCIFGNYNEFTLTNYDPKKQFQEEEDLPTLFINTENLGYKYFKSTTLPGKNESILCYFDIYNYYLNCSKYNIIQNKIIKFAIINLSEEPLNPYCMFIKYFPETEQILIGLIDFIHDLRVAQCTKDLLCTEIFENSFSSNIWIVYPNIVIPSDKNNYYLLIYDDNEEINLSNEDDYLSLLDNLAMELVFPEQTYSFNSDLVCENYYNYEQNGCIESIPDGYYCNSTQLKTIDKCNENCKTCNQGPTTENNNCLTCKEETESENIYYDLGNCISSCDYFIRNSKLICKCSVDEKCNICTQESVKLNLCVTCNFNLHYYKKIDDEVRIDGFINCYNNLEGYYLKDEIFYPCFSSCKTCSEEGNEIDHKCNECKDGYENKNDLINDFNETNCYKKCEYYYYYDSNNTYYCTITNSCPQDYNKLISSKGRCIDECNKDNIYKYEYRNKCYIECPTGTKISNENNYLCEVELYCENFYNYNLTDCIDTIPNGYYCNDTDLKTIDKCHENCETCNKGPTNTNNNCLKCKESYFYNLGNCVRYCPKGM